MKNHHKPAIEAFGGSIPVLGFGTWQLHGDKAEVAVQAALDTGFRHIDTARAYGNEKEVGQGIKASDVSRSDIFLTTKIPKDHLKPEDVKEQMDKSLMDLNTDYVDLLLIHWPSKKVPVEDTLGAMFELKEAGKMRNVGVSNFTETLLEEALDVSPGPIFCNQIEYHPYLAQDNVINFCRSRRLAVEAYSPLAKGRAPKDGLLQEIGSTHGKNAAQVTIRWLLQQNGIVCLPKSGNPEHIRQNFDVFDFELSEEEMERISALNKGKRLISPSWAPEWD